jgi:hypothetical protein
MRYSFFISAVFTSLLISSSVFAVAQTSVWYGAEGGDWGTPGNWVPAVVPTALDPIGGPQANPYSLAQFSVTNTSPNLTAGVTVACDALRVGYSSGMTLAVNGATINVSEILYLGYSSTETATLNMISGTINCGARIPASGKLYVGRSGIATLNVSNGVINVPAALSIAEVAGTGWVHLNGGTINAADLLMNTAGAHLDLAGGTLILDGNDIAAIDTFIAAGKITAYGGEAGSSVLRDYDVTNAGKTTIRGLIVTPKATAPNPVNNAANVSCVSIFGTTNPPPSQGSVNEAAFNPGLLIPNTTYYWQIDEVSGSGTQTGDLWTFTTVNGLPSTPDPANNTITGIHPILSWTGGLGATGHNVYFGTENPPTTLASSNQGTTTFDPGTLSPNAQYFWQVEELYGSNFVAGPVWNFSTANTRASLSGSEFCPRNGDVNMPVSGITLAWHAGTGALSHDVYFGTTNPPAFQVNQTDTTFPLGFITPNTTYYWRIDEKDSSGSTTIGDLWSFTTGEPVEIHPYITFRGDPNSSITVNWWNPAAEGDSSVDYGLTDSYGLTATDAQITRYHHVELTGLAENTVYHYRIRSSDGTVGSDNIFKTAPASTAQSFTFAFYGDPRTTEFDEGGIYSARQQALCDWIAAQSDIAFAIEGGDVVWEGSTLRSMGLYWPGFFNYEQNLNKSKVVMHTIGGHEFQGGYTHYYWNDFYTDAYPTNGPAGTNGYVYSFDYANAHFVCLASYMVDLTAQKNWLIADLTAAKTRGAKWLFAYMHYPLYTNSGHLPLQSDLAAFGPVFDQFHVSVVFGSHNHVYERWAPINTYYDDEIGVWTGKAVPNGEGTVYITDGMGGAEFNNSAPDPRLIKWFGAALNTTLVTKVTISGDQACLVQAIRNDTGEVIDTYVVFPPYLTGDLNGDGVVNGKDLAILAAHWLQSGMWP